MNVQQRPLREPDTAAGAPGRCRCGGAQNRSGSAPRSRTVERPQCLLKTRCEEQRALLHHAAKEGDEEQIVLVSGRRA